MLLANRLWFFSIKTTGSVDGVHSWLTKNLVLEETSLLAFALQLRRISEIEELPLLG